MKIETDDILFEGTVYTKNVIKQALTTFKATDTTPNISGITLAIASTNIITITNFLGGVDGQNLRILGDGGTTIANNSNIKTNTGANKLLAANKIYSFSYVDFLKQWFESA